MNVASARRCALFAACVAALARGCLAAELPARIAPGQPFPQILSQAPDVETIAPGIAYGTYALMTSAGPVVVRVAAIATHRADVRVGTVAAHDVLTSAGEPVSSMAARTGAVAGINGDYYDIGNTNRPTNVLVRGGRMLHTPSKRYALIVDRSGSASFSELAFAGQTVIGANTVGLDAVNDMPPPHGGVALITPEFGRVAPSDNLTLVGLTLLDGTPPFARYRVTQILDNTQSQGPGYYLAVGPQAYGPYSVPNTGDIVEPSGDLTPLGTSAIAEAIGGGPLILRDGAWYDDPDGPSGGEYAQRIPSSGAAIARDGTLFLIEVDGRQPSRSVGLTRPEFAALMRALGGVDGMAFDGGGSSAIAVRRLGDAGPQLQSSPSDRVERKVSDGIFAYSTAPVTAAVRLVASPAIVRAAPGATVSLRSGAIDASAHLVGTPGAVVATLEPATLGTYRDGRFTATRPGSGKLILRAGQLRGEVPVEVVATPAEITIEPADPNVAAGGSVQLSAIASADGGYSIALPERLDWHAEGGAIDAGGVFRAGKNDGIVTLDVGGRSAQTRVTVGTHDAAIAVERPRFATVPRGGPGSLDANAPCNGCIALSYELSATVRAAYAIVDAPLPPQTIAVAFRVRTSDVAGSAHMRVSIRNAINEQVLLDALPIASQPGWQDVEVRLPAGFAGPGRLTALYVLRDAEAPAASGTLTVGGLHAIVAGR